MVSLFRSSGDNTRNVVVVGSRDRAPAIKNTIAKPRRGYKILGCFAPDEDLAGMGAASGCKMLGEMGQLEDYLSFEKVDELVFAMPLKDIEEGNKYIAIAESRGICVKTQAEDQRDFLDYLLPGIFFVCAIPFLAAIVFFMPFFGGIFLFILLSLGIALAVKTVFKRTCFAVRRGSV
jgi:hypothetical protein